MTHQEDLILEFLRANPENFFARREIARKAVRRDDYEADRNWANAPLANLVGQRLVEMNESGYYRLKQKRI